VSLGLFRLTAVGKILREAVRQARQYGVRVAIVGSEIGHENPEAGCIGGDHVEIDMQSRSALTHQRHCDIEYLSGGDIELSM
jgi:hypothetical protein